MRKFLLSLFAILASMSVRADTLAENFTSPPRENHPETWFHLIGGNVSKPELTSDLQAVQQAGIRGIQLFHGRGNAWPHVSEQIQSLSPEWDGMIEHVADETSRLGLDFTMQNCPGWAMSGGPWITPDKAMRHLIWSRLNIEGGRRISVELEVPQPSSEDWRDYRDVAVLAFPTPADDTGEFLHPVAVRSNARDQPWSDLWNGTEKPSIIVDPGEDPAWVELEFASPTYLRSIELPPIEHLMRRRNFDQDSTILIQVNRKDAWQDLVRHKVPRGTWQDRQPEHPLVLAVPDAESTRFRIVFENKHSIELYYLRLSSAARLHNWQTQAGYALRSLERRPPPIQSPAAWIAKGSIIDLSGKVDTNGRLDWTAPADDWTIVRFGHVNTGVKNKPAPPEATGFECDKLSPAGAEQHFAGYIGRVSAPGGPADGGRLKGMLIDSWECYTQTWTPAMEREFEARRGYALRPWLPAMAGWIIGDHLTTERFLRDWRATISDLLVENYFGRLAELARERGMKLSFETALGDVSPGDILQYFGKADIPMCEFWQPNDPHWGGLETKPIAPAASAAHIYGKPIVAAEAFTHVGQPNLAWDEHPFSLKHQADLHFTRGINHLVFHTYTHNPGNQLPGTSFGSRIGSPFVRGQTWWRYMPLFTDYLARCEYMLAQGRPVSDVLWYLGDDLDHKPRQNIPFPNGVRFDYLNADVLMNRVHVEDGKLRIQEGTSWHVLWLAPEQCERMLPSTLARIRDLIAAGAVVIGGPPKQNPSLNGGNDADIQFSNLVTELWGQRPARTGDRELGKGRLLWGATLEESLATLGIRPDVAGTRSATWIHRQLKDTHIYFIAADRVTPLDANLRFRAEGVPEFWDPMTGETSIAKMYHCNGHHTIVPVSLPAAGSIFVVFRPGESTARFTRIEIDDKPWTSVLSGAQADGGKPYPYLGLQPGDELQPWVSPQEPAASWIDGGQHLLSWRNGTYSFYDNDTLVGSAEIENARSIAVDGSWTVSFPKGWEAPARIELGTVQPWSELEDEGARHFSGTAVYETTVQLEPSALATRMLLDLGRVDNIAAIKVNGENVATLWAPPFRTDITPYVRPGENRIEIRVTNSWHNRLVYDASLPEEQRKTWTILGPKADNPLEVAGITGPVVIRCGEIVPID